MNDIERKQLILSVASLLVTWSLTVIGAVWAASSHRATLAGEVQAHSHQIIDHEARLRTLERQTSEIAADVRWIRKTLEVRTP